MSLNPIRWLLVLIAWVRSWWRCRRRRRAFTGVCHIESGVDPATELMAWRLVLVGPAEKPKWLRLRCPCGCGDVIALNLMTSHKPRWEVEEHDGGTLTVYPSVDSRNCGAHFWIRGNKIHWV